MKRIDKVKLIKKWFKEGKIKKLGNNCYSVTSTAFELGITPRLIDEVLNGY